MQNQYCQVVSKWNLLGTMNACPLHPSLPWRCTRMLAPCKGIDQRLHNGSSNRQEKWSDSSYKNNFDWTLIAQPNPNVAHWSLEFVDLDILCPVGHRLLRRQQRSLEQRRPGPGRLGAMTTAVHGRMWCHKEVLETSKTWAHHYQERLTLRLQVESVLDLWARQLCQWQRDLRGDSGSTHIWHVELTQNMATFEHATRTKCLALRPFTWHWVNWVILATTNGVVVSLGSQTQKPGIPTTKVTIALKVLAYAGCTHLAVKQNCL